MGEPAGGRVPAEVVAVILDRAEVPLAGRLGGAGSAEFRAVIHMFGFASAPRGCATRHVRSRAIASRLAEKTDLQLGVFGSVRSEILAGSVFALPSRCLVQRCRS